jgi:MFS family permease
MGASSRSLKGLDWANLFMADVKDGVGVYLSVFLLTVRHWQPDQIGYVIAVPGLVGILIQPLAGALIDRSTYKRYLLIFASAVIALCCFVIIVMKGFYPTFLSQAMVGLVQSVYTPGVAAITLGMVGQAALSKRIGRNETFNHVGNMGAAIVAGLIGRYISYEGIFYFSILQCVALIIAVLFIKEQDIDHNLARAAGANDATQVSATGLKTLLSNRNILLFTISMALFHLANAAMLPLVGQKMGLLDQKNSSLYLSAAIIMAQGVMALVASYSGRTADNGRKAIMMIAFALLPVRALLFAFIDNPYALTGIQLLDGIGAGIFGVVSILMMSDLSEGTGRFNLLQGCVYSAIGLAASISSIVGGIVVKQYGYRVGFIALAGIAIAGIFFFYLLVPETKGINSTKETVPSD